jgi:hypothetical protein
MPALSFKRKPENTGFMALYGIPGKMRGDINKVV